MPQDYQDIQTLAAKGQTGKFAYLKYVGRVAAMTGKTKEVKNLDEVHNILDLICNLDDAYPGFKEVFIPPNGVFNSTTGIICRRTGEPSFAVTDRKFIVKDGDVLTFW